MDKIKPLSRIQIDNEAIAFLNKYNKDAIENPQKLDLEDIIENKLQLSIDYQILDSDNHILGMTVFKSGNIEVLDENKNKKYIRVEKNTMVFNEELASNLKQQGRFRFTLAHEIGHWVLHRKYYFIDENQLNLFDELGENDFIKCLNRNENDMITNQNKTNIDWLEWQADNFASSLLMPKNIFKITYEKLTKELSNEKEVISKLSSIFGTSKQACQIRLNILYNKDILDNQLKISN